MSYFCYAKNVNFVSILLIVVSNSIPFWGVLYGGWELETLFHLYWYETVVIGIFALLKVPYAQDPPSTFLSHETFAKLPDSVSEAEGRTIFGLSVRETTKEEALKFSKIEYSPFIIVPFMIMHLSIFLYVTRLFITSYFSGESTFTITMLFSLIALSIHYVWHFIHQYIGQKRYLLTSKEDLVFYPYQRIFVILVTCIVGLIFKETFSMADTALAGLIIGKAILDIALFMKEHKKKLSANTHA